MRKITGPEPYISVGSEAILPCDDIDVFGALIAPTLRAIHA